MSQHLPILIVLPLLFGAFVVTLVGFGRPRWSFPLTVLAVSLSATAAVWALVRVVDDGVMRYALGGWPPPLGIEYVVDRVSGFVAAVIMVVSALVIVGTRRMAAREMGGRRGPFYGTMLMMLTGLVGIVLTGDMFNLFVFLEISSLAAYALIFMGGPKAMIASFRYLIVGTAGGALYLLGVGYLYFATGTLNMGDMASRLPDVLDSSAVLAGAALIFAGLAVKMALVPLHWWLPDAYNYAPSSVTALVAPIGTKVAAYVMLRMFLTVFPAGYLTDRVPVATVIIVLGLVGSVAGGLAAVVEKDLRRILAYSSISQLGLIATGIGLASPLAATAALFHVMAHSVMKASLFLVATNIRYRTAQVHIDRMSGLARVMPWSVMAFVIVAVSMVGVPPTAGFFSKFYLVQAAFAQDHWVVGGVVLASSLLTAIYMVRFIERAYLGSIPSADEAGAQEADRTAANAVRQATEMPADAVVPALLLAAASFVLGLANVPIITRIIGPGLGA